MLRGRLDGIGWTGRVLRLSGAVTGAPEGTDVEVLLLERDGDRSYSVPAASEPARDGIAYEAEVDVSGCADGGPLPHGLWDVRLSAAGAAAPLGQDRGPDLVTTPQRRFLADSSAVVSYFTPGGDLAIDVGGDPHAAGTAAQADSVTWAGRDEEVVVAGHIDVPDRGLPVSATFTLRERSSGRTYEVIAALDTGPERLDFTAEVSMTRAIIDDPLPAGVWDAYVIVGFSGMHRELRVLAPDGSVDRRVRRRLRHLRVHTSRAPDPLTVTVGRA